MKLQPISKLHSSKALLSFQSLMMGICEAGDTSAF